MNFLEVLAPLLPAAAIALVITGLVYAGSARRSRRYRPGRPFSFKPVWFLARQEQVAQVSHRVAVESREHPQPLPAGGQRPAEQGGGPLPTEQRTQTSHGATGGASDRW